MLLTSRIASNWGWVVVMMTWTQNVVMFGIMYSYGLLFIEFQEEFDSSATLTGWAGAIPIALSILLAPALQIIIDRFGYRPVAVVSLVLSSTGVVATSFVPNMLLAYLTYGLLYGCGAGSLTLVTLGLIVHYFPSRNSVRALALALSGSSLGMLAFAPLYTLLFDLFGWRNTLRIMGSLHFVVGIPCVASFVKSISNEAPSRRDPEKVGDCSKTEVTQTLKDEQVNDDTHLNSSSKCSTERYVSGKQANLKTPEEERDSGKCLLDGDTAKEILANGSRLEKETLETVTTSDDAENSTLWQRLRQAFTYPELWMISVAVIITGVLDCFYYVNMVSYMVSVGYSEADGARFLSVMGASTLVGKLGLSFFGELLPFPSYYLMVITCLVSIVVMCSFLVARSLALMLFLAAVIGGVMMTITNVVTVTIPNLLFGPERFRQTWPVVLFCNGVGFLCGSVAGQSIDHTGSYRIAIYFSIGLYIFVCLLFIGAPLYQKMFAPDRYVLHEIHRSKRSSKLKASKKEGSRLLVNVPILEARETKLEVTYERVTSI